MQLMLIAALLAAHPGHGTTDPGSWRHYLTEPVHYAVILAAGASVWGAVWGLRVLRRRRTRGTQGAE